MSSDQGGAFSWPSVGQTDRQAFEVVRRGYDRAQVEEYLDTLEHDVKTLRSRVGKLEAELESARQRAETAPEHPASQDPYAAVSDYIAPVMRALVHEVERLRAQANEEVERMLSEARADADRIQQDTESRADEVPGDFIVIDSAQVGSLTREGEVLEVIQGAVSVSYRVKWADGHESLIAPTGGSARIVPASLYTVQPDL